MMQKIRYISMPNTEESDAVEESIIEELESTGKRHFVKVNETLFVNEVKKRPILYNVMHRDYKKITVRKEAWKEIGITMGLSIQECKKRWRSMRDSFLKTLRNRGEEDSKSWIHYRLLEFLLPYARIVLKGQQKPYSNDFYEYNDNSSDCDYLALENDPDMYGKGPVTVSYVTEDGKELFQILHRPCDAELPESEMADDEQELEEVDEVEPDTQLTSLLRPHGATVDEAQNQNQKHCQVETVDADYLVSSDPEDASDCESVFDDDQLDSTMFNFCKTSEPERNGVIDSSLVKRETKSIQTPDEYYESTEETLPEPDPELEVFSNPYGKRRKRDPDVCEAVKEKICGNYSSYPLEAATPEPPVTPTTPSTLTLSQPEEEPRNHSSRESDARLGITDPDERFLMSCAPILRRLPTKKNLLARLRIQQMLYELEYDEKYDGT